MLVLVTLGLTKYTSYRQLRAYVFSGAPFAIKHIDGDDWEISTCIRNGGQTPARNVAVRTAIEYGSFPIQEGQFPQIEKPWQVMYATIGPQAERPYYLLMKLSADTVDRIKAKRGCVMLRFSLSYTTYLGLHVQEPELEYVLGHLELRDGSMTIFGPQHSRQEKD